MNNPSKKELGFLQNCIIVMTSMIQKMSKLTRKRQIWGSYRCSHKDASQGWLVMKQLGRYNIQIHRCIKICVSNNNKINQRKRITQDPGHPNHELFQLLQSGSNITVSRVKTAEQSGLRTVSNDSVRMVWPCLSFIAN